MHNNLDIISFIYYHYNILAKVLCITYQLKAQSLNIRKEKMLVFCFVVVEYVILINKQAVHFSNQRLYLTLVWHQSSSLSLWVTGGLVWSKFYHICNALITHNCFTFSPWLIRNNTVFVWWYVDKIRINLKKFFWFIFNYLMSIALDDHVFHLWYENTVKPNQTISSLSWKERT